MKARAVVTAGSMLTAQAAEGILREGGNAYDAALAALAAACVAEPVLASLGGGGFMLAHPASGTPRLYDFFVHTPRAGRPSAEIEFRPVRVDFGTTEQEFHIGRGSVAVPGVVRGWFRIHRELASLPQRELLAPAVEYATHGFALNAFQGYALSAVGAIYRDNPEAAALYGSAGGERLLRAGERLVQPALADVLETLAVEGEELFYRGEIAQAIAGDMREAGHLTAEDLAAYRATVRRPLALDYHGARVLTNPPPASGGLLVGVALGLLDPLDPARLGFGTPAHLALLTRVMELTSEVRAAAHEDAGTPHPDAERVLDPALLAAYRERIAGRAPSRRGTTQISIIDAQHNVASLSVSNGEGSAYVVPGTGIMLNNMLGEEDLAPGGFHRWRADERVSSMMAPSVVHLPESALVATGSGGSNRIRSAILQVLLNILDFEMSVEEAVLAPRVHYERGLLSVEGGFERAPLAPLLREFPRHQLWPDRNLFFGGAHTVAARRGGFEGAGDPRRGGVCVLV